MTMQQIPRLQLDAVTKTFPQQGQEHLTALDGITLHVDGGRKTALVGPDGAGKTTLLRLIAGLLKPDHGDILYDGKPIAAYREHYSSRLGYMPQKFGLYEDLTVQENLDLYADLKSVPFDERETRYRQLLAMSAMEPFRKRLAGKLSGGMKQKLGLICTLIRPPELLLLDEPTVGVDPFSRRELWEIVRELTSGTGMSVIVSTSYLDEAEDCDEVLVLHEGRALAQGRPSDITGLSAGMGFMASPAEGDTARSLQVRLLGSPGIIDAVPEGGAVRFIKAAMEPGEQELHRRLLKGAAVQAVSPRIEDSIMLLLNQRKGSGNAGDAPEMAEKQACREAALSSHQPPVIQTEHVSRYFGDFAAVDDVSFSVGKGEIFGLLGPNGAGKTTTFRMLCGLLPASKGRLSVAGIDVTQSREEARERLGYVAQKFSLYGPLNTKENLDFFAEAYGLSGERKKHRVQAVIEDFDLAGQIDTPASQLPGGFRQRLSMAAALMHEPDIIFLDEPTSGADPLARRAFWKRIAGLAERGVTVIVTTHFMEEAEYCDRILIQDSGKMIALGTPAEIRHQAVTETQPFPTMEDAFIAIVSSARHQKAGASA